MFAEVKPNYIHGSSRRSGVSRVRTSLWLKCGQIGVSLHERCTGRFLLALLGAFVAPFQQAHSVFPLLSRFIRCGDDYREASSPSSRPSDSHHLERSSCLRSFSPIRASHLYISLKMASHFDRATLPRLLSARHFFFFFLDPSSICVAHEPRFTRHAEQREI